MLCGVRLCVLFLQLLMSLDQFWFLVGVLLSFHAAFLINRNL